MRFPLSPLGQCSSSVLKQRSLKTALIVGTLLFGGATASYAANYSVIQAGLGASGVVAQKVLRYPLVRQDITATLRGVTVSSATIAGGYLAFEQVSNGVFFYDGAIPVLAKELPKVEQGLAAGSLSITNVSDAVADASQDILLIHIEGTTSDTALVAGLGPVLNLINNPQLNVQEMEVPQDSLNLPPSAIPAKDLKLLNKGTFSIINNDTIVFSVPRADDGTTFLGSVKASEPLGVGQTIVASGNGTAGIVAEFTLRADEVQQVTSFLVNGGFTIVSQGDYFVDDSNRLTFIRAEAVAKNPDPNKALTQLEKRGEALVKALLTIKKHAN